MDIQATKKLNKQAVWFVILNTILIMNVAIEFYSVH